MLPNVEKARIERSGNQRWLVVAGTPDKAWDTVKEFWLENGLLIKIEQPEAGVIETGTGPRTVPRFRRTHCATSSAR